MPFSAFLKSAAGTCPFCRQKAGILSREHQGCRRTYQAGWDEMVQLAAQAAASRTFDEKSLRLNLAEIARRSYGHGATANRVQSDLNPNPPMDRDGRGEDTGRGRGSNRRGWSGLEFG